MGEVYLVTDMALCRQGGHDLQQVVQQALEAGLRWVQLREKEDSTRVLLKKAVLLRQLTRAYGAKLVINDRIDVALAAGADGVHIGQSDMPYPLTRKLLGPDKIIGLSVTNLAEWEEAEPWDVDYLGVGPIFHTDTKPDIAPPLGLEGLQQIGKQSRHRLFAIGGIHPANVAEVMATGMDGIAVVSAICAAPCPKAAALELIELIHPFSKAP